VFCRRRWFQGRPLRGTADILWLHPDGTEMTEHDWNAPEVSVGLFLNGEAITSPGLRGERVVDRSFLLLINPSADPRKWTISGSWGQDWECVLDTAYTADRPADDAPVRGDLVVTDRSVVLLRRIEPDDA
jgi:glycogen operon protein